MPADAFTAATLGTMFVMGDIFANMPIYIGLAGSLASFVRRRHVDEVTA